MGGLSLLGHDEPSASTPRPLRGRIKHPLRHRVAVGCTIFMAVLVALVGAGVGYAAIQSSRLKEITFGIPKGGGEAAVTKASKGEPVNILVVGSDSRAFAKDLNDRKRFGADKLGGTQRSDTMMVMRLDPKNDRAAILSIARDVYVDLEGGGKGRINEAFSKVGDPSKADPDRLIRTIKKNFGISINHYVEIDFAGFRDVVSALGGVSVYFPFPARDAYSELNVTTTGCVKLDGPSALSYVRSREYEFKGPKGWQFDPTGDIGRIQRQQDFIKRVVRKAVTDGLTNPVKAAKLIEAGIDNVQVDKGFGVADMKKLASQLGGVDDGKIAFSAITGDPVKIGGASVLRINPERANEVLAAFGAKIPGSSTTVTTRRGATVPALVPVGTSVVLFNAAGRDGLVAQVQSGLSGLGVRASSGGNAKVTAATTEIGYRAGGEAAAKSVQALLGGGVQLVLDRTVKSGQIVVRLGNSFTGVIDPRTTTTTLAPTTTLPGPTPTTLPPRGSDPSVAC